MDLGALERLLFADGPWGRTRGIRLPDFAAIHAELRRHRHDPNFAFPGSNISVPGQASIITTQHDRFRPERSGPRFIDMRLRLEF